MLTLPTPVRIYLARGATDMRKAIDGLAAVTKSVLDHDPLSGHLFAFCNRRRDRIKILHWEQSGFLLLHKRLEKGTCAWPAPAECDAKQIELSATDLAALLDGLDLQRAARRTRVLTELRQNSRLSPHPFTACEIEHSRKLNALIVNS